MSSEFYLPVKCRVSPRPIGAVIVAAHCLPLPLLAAAPAGWAWALLPAALSLAWHLHGQRAAAAATAIESVAGGWLLHRHDGRRAQISILDCADFGGFMLLLLRENHDTFRVLARADAATRAQWHKLRVLLKWEMRAQLPPERE